MPPTATIAAYLPSLVASQTVYGNDLTHPATQSTFSYDTANPTATPSTPGQYDPPSYTKRGNLTGVSRLVTDLFGLFPGSGPITDTREFDTVGNLISYTDPLGKKTTYSYADSCAGATPPSPIFGLLTQVSYPDTGTTQTRTWGYDCYLGKPVSFTDRDGVGTTYAFENSTTGLNRLTTITHGAKTTFTYGDSSQPNYVETRKEQYTAGVNRGYTKTLYDGMGREYETDSGTNSVIVNKRVLDGFGRVFLEYLPSSTDYRQYSYDAIGRVTSVTNSVDSSVIRYEYSLNAVKVTDEAVAASVRYSDALGRLTTVIEDPGQPPSQKNYTTSYGYDAADRLLTVTQGTVSRVFDYDTLGHLRRAANPERGQTTSAPTTYTYDANGNITQRIEPDGSSVTSTYDALNRLVGRGYGGVVAALTPSAVWCYDGQNPDVVHGTCIGGYIKSSYGKLTGSGSSASSTTYTHDTLGRLTTSTQTTSGVNYQFTYSYYLDDSEASVQYPLPSSKVITTCYDEHGRPVWVSKVKNPSDCVATPDTAPPPASAYVTALQYEAHGGLRQMQYGNTLWHSIAYNGRLQQSTLRLGASSTGGELWKQDYTYGTSNNGNIRSTTLTIPGVLPITTAYRYDAVNRLTGAVENGDISRTSALCGSANGAWCVDYGYDAQGNRTLVGSQGLGSGVGVPIGFSSTTNRIADSGWQYDGRGNVILRPGAVQSDQFLFDTEDRLVTVCMATTGSCSDKTVSAGRTVYDYDADGRRVYKHALAGSTVYVYDGHGRLAAETGAPGTVSGTRYVMQDHLGSTRVAMGSSGVTERHDFMPFGEEIGVSSGSPRSGVSGYGVDLETRIKFTGKVRGDTITEGGLDYFGARYFSGAQGRFTSPDAPFADQHVEDPQSWNLYSYTRNNPLALVDDGGSQARPATEVMIGPLPDGSVNHRVWDVGMGALKSVGLTGTSMLRAMGADSNLMDRAESALMPSNARQEMVMKMTDFAQNAEGAKSLAAGGILVIRNPVALGQEITRLGRNIGNNLKSLDAEHMGAAIRELAGEVVKINPRDGQPYDHVTEVRNAAQGLTNSATRIKGMLGYSNLTGKARSALEGQLRQANQKLDELRKSGIIP